MAINDIEFFNFYYRYLWTQSDFAKFQTGLSDQTRATNKGIFNGSVVNGLSCLRSASRTVRVQPGFAVSPSGAIMYLEVQTTYAFTAPASFPERALLVMRPLITQNTPITSPVDPNTQVFLNQKQGYEVVMLRGTPGLAPAYPAKGADDVVLCGVYLDPVANFDGSADIDYSVRDLPMKNATGLDANGLYDDRLRPYKLSNTSVGIKPSFQGEVTFLGAQPVRAKAWGHTFINPAVPSRYPRDTFQSMSNLDATINFTTGIIGGGDSQSSAFTPSIPSAGKFQLALLQVDATDKVQIKFANIGIYYSSKSGIWSDITGGVVTPTAGTKLLAYVILSSTVGSVVEDLEVIDARSLSNVAVASGGSVEDVVMSSLPKVLSAGDNGKIFLIDCVSKSGQTITIATLPNGVANFKVQFKDKTGFISTCNASINLANAAAQLEGVVNGVYPLQADRGSWTFSSDANGTNYYVV